ncbi:hypothetical protein RRG08_003539 [Elysia crispata]|uniref:Uncharacterized protein n=1 Tax=Elysia crispata TaxID=231223 RepID=A0AAE1CU05_9GAST|nr:hypothetical protein RRG08_003539 [Elysia crispata]
MSVQGSSSSNDTGWAWVAGISADRLTRAEGWCHSSSTERSLMASLMKDSAAQILPPCFVRAVASICPALFDKSHSP